MGYTLNHFSSYKNKPGFINIQSWTNIKGIVTKKVINNEAVMEAKNASVISVKIKWNDFSLSEGARRASLACSKGYDKRYIICSEKK